MKRFVFVIFSCITAITAAVVFAADNERLFQLRKSIADEKRRIEEIKKSADSLAETKKEFTQTHRERLASRNSDIRKLGDELTALNGNFINEKALLAVAQGKEKNYTLQLDQYKKAVKERMRDYCEMIKTGFPYKLDERTAALDRLISEADVGSVRGEELYNNFTAILYKDLNSGFDSEVYSFDNQKLLRIGWMFLAARSEADDLGEDIKLLDRNSDGWFWREDCGIGERKAVRDSMEMVEGKKTPTLDSFPVPLSLIRESARRR